MPDKKFKTPNGKIVSESELTNKYGEKFNSLVENKTFSEVSEPVYKTPNGSYEAESVLQSKYGEKFDELKNNKTFILDSPLKKKDNSQESGQNPQRASLLSQGTKRPSWDTESPKKPLVSDGLVGESRKNLKSVLEANKLDKFVSNKPIEKQTSKEVLKQSKETTLGLTKKPSGSLSVAKTKAPTSMSEVIEGNEILKPIIAEKVYQYRDQTRLTEEEKKDTEQQLADKENTVGFMNNAIDMFHQATNYFSKGAFIKDDPLSDEKQRAKDYFKEVGVTDASPVEINNKAKELFIDDKNTEKKQQKINDFLEDIDPQVKTYLEVDADKRFKTIDKKRNDISNRISLNEKYANTLLEDLKDQNLSIQDKENKQNELKKVAGYLKKDTDVYNSLESESSTAEDELNSFRKNYNRLDNVTGRFKSGLMEMGSGIVAATGYMSQYSGSPLGTLYNMQSQEAALNVKKSSDLIRESLRPDNTELTVDNFIQSSIDVLAGQAPNLALAGATGGGSAVIIGIGQAGTTYNDMWEKQMSGKNTYSPAQMAFAPLVSGISTGALSALPTFYTLRNAANVFKAALREEAVNLTLKKSITNTASKLSKDILKNYGTEIPTEVADNIIQNAIKKDILGDKSVNYFDNTGNVIKNTAIMTGMISAAPHIGISAVKMFSKNDDTKILNRNGIKIKEYLLMLDDVNVDEKTKGILKKSIDAMTLESSNIINKTLNNISKIDDGKVEVVTNNNKRISEIKTEVDIIKENGNLTNEQKQFELDGLKKETVEIIKENSDIIEEADKTSSRKRRVAEEVVTKPTEEKNVYYYNTDPKRGEVEARPETVPEGYSTIQEVQNSAELELWKNQKETPTEEVITPTEEVTPKGTKETVVFDANKIDIIKEPTPAKTRKVPKEKLIEEVKPTEEVKVETKEKEKRVSLPKVIDDSNFDEVIKNLKDFEKLDPCGIK
jgi:DNA-binding MltR family transcriptional regulator